MFSSFVRKFIALSPLILLSYADKAENPGLCLAVARHYWNSCLPLIETPAERRQLQEPLEKILSALARSSAKDTNV